MLVALASLAHIVPPDAAVASVSAVFSGPAFCDTPYTLTAQTKGNAHTAVVTDGSTAVARITAHCDGHGATQDLLRDGEPRFRVKPAPTTALRAIASTLDGIERRRDTLDDS